MGAVLILLSLAFLGFATVAGISLKRILAVRSKLPAHSKRRLYYWILNRAVTIVLFLLLIPVTLFGALRGDVPLALIAVTGACAAIVLISGVMSAIVERDPNLNRVLLPLESRDAEAERRGRGGRSH